MGMSRPDADRWSTVRDRRCRQPRILLRVRASAFAGAHTPRRQTGKGVRSVCGDYRRQSPRITRSVKRRPAAAIFPRIDLRGDRQHPTTRSKSLIVRPAHWDAMSALPVSGAPMRPNKVCLKRSRSVRSMGAKTDAGRSYSTVGRGIEPRLQPGRHAARRRRCWHRRDARTCAHTTAAIARSAASVQRADGW